MGPDLSHRRRAATFAGYSGDEAAARAAQADPAPEVRAAGLSALARMGALGGDDVAGALSDPEVMVRRRGCDLAGRQHASLPVPSAELVGALARATHDPAPEVVEAACHALGEVGYSSDQCDDAALPSGLPVPDRDVAVAALTAVAAGHRDPLCREAAVAALGSVGAPGGLAAVLGALSDKPAVRRRAVVALAAFEGDEVVRALRAAARDPDWQVRQVAEDLRGYRPRLN